jgi:hypothetical protein
MYKIQLQDDIDVLMKKLEIGGFFDIDNASVNWVLPITKVFVFPYVS